MGVAVGFQEAETGTEQTERTGYSLPYQLINNLEEHAKIEDNRSLFQ